jgi:hypothetical protein
MANHGPMHWRGDRTGGNDAGGSALDENAAFLKFNPAFVGLLGAAAQLSPSDMQAFASFILEVTPPPNPIRALDDSLTPAQAAGRTDYFNTAIDGGIITCNACHVLNPAQGFFGSDGDSSFEGEPQHFKIPHLRNMYEKVGMFGMPQVAFIGAGAPTGHQGPQIRGFGFIHDGSIDTLFRFHKAVVFNFPGGDPQIRDMEQFMFAFDTNLKPIVGQQVTLSSTNSAVVTPRLNLLIARALAGDADLIAKGAVAGEMRGYSRLSNGLFRSDRVSQGDLSDSSLSQLAAVPGQELTYTAGPAGSGTRAGIDRDKDGILDGDEGATADADADGVPDAIDNCTSVVNPVQFDADGDGCGNRCDADSDQNGIAGGSDFNALRLCFGKIWPAAGPPEDPTCAESDLDESGIVGGGDFNLLRLRFGEAPGPGAACPF